MKKIILVIVIILLSLNFKSNANTPLTFIEKYKNTALELMQYHNIPASVILAISAHESGYGTSKLSKINKNFFGIKKNANSYRMYENDIESFQDFCNFISVKKYYSFLTSNNIIYYKDWIHKIQSGGYAEDPNWSNKILNYIEKYKLYELDNMKQDIVDINNNKNINIF